MKKSAFIFPLLLGMGIFVSGLTAAAEAPTPVNTSTPEKEASTAAPGTSQQPDRIVTVEPYDLTEAIKIKNIPSEPVIVGTRLKLKVQISPEINQKKKILWSSSNKKVASITSKGIVKARKKGTTVITAKLKNTGKKASFKLRVRKRVKLKKITLSGKKEIYAREAIQLTTVLKPQNTTDRDIVWKCSNTKVADVSKNGLVTTKKPGNITITAKEKKRKKSAKFKIKVLKVPVTGIRFATNNKTSIKVGAKISLAVHFTPLNATNHTLRWKSSNSSAATVDKNGTVTALCPTENVTITATSAENKNIYCKWNLQITFTDGYITKSSLDKLDLTTIRKVMFVTHPDDETLWGGAHLLEDEYLVVCMTNGWNKKRKAAFTDIMHKTNDKAIILNYPDVKEYLGNGKYLADQFSTCRDAMQKDINQVLSYKKWKQVITHNPFGEYGKYHHQQVSKAVTEGFNKICKGNSELWYFGKYYNKGQEIPGERIDPELLSIKYDMIAHYYPTASGAINAFGQMIPYENWILAENW